MPVGLRWLAASAALAGVGAFVVLLAFSLAGGGDRPRPHPGLLDAEGDCVTGDVGDAPRYDPTTGRPTPFPACPDLRPDDLEREYVLAWVGVALALAGCILLLLVVTITSPPRLGVYGSLGGVAGCLLVVAGVMAIASTVQQIDISFVGSEPDPWDAFDRAALMLAIAGVALVPVAALLRAVVSRPAAGT
jgi:hypothetical protein